MNTDNKKQLGQFYTTQVDYILQDFKDEVKDKHVIDPFCGNEDLLSWAAKYGSLSTVGYDIDPKTPSCIKQDTLLNPPDYSSRFVLTNPPYLLRGKSKDKTVYDKWKTDDLYKCFILSLISSAQEGIIIVPINFISSDSDKVRDKFFSVFTIEKIVIFEERVFEDTSATVIALLFKRDGSKKTSVSFKATLYPSKQKIQCILEKQHKWKYGADFYSYIDVNTTVKVSRLIIGDNAPNTSILFYGLDGGSTSNRIRLEIVDTPFYGKQSDRSKAHIVLNVVLTDEQQHYVVEQFNTLIEQYRNQYCSLFLPNYRESSSLYARKRMGFTLAYKLIAAIIERDIR